MDFIEGLPTSKGSIVIMFIIDIFSNYGNFLPLKHHYTLESVAQVFMQQIFKLHGIPEHSK